MTKNGEECFITIKTPHVDEVYEVKVFDNKIKVNMCRKHIKEYNEIMTLYSNGYDVEEILAETPEYRKKEADKFFNWQWGTAVMDE